MCDDGLVCLELVAILLAEPHWSQAEVARWRAFLEQMPEHLYAVSLAATMKSKGQHTLAAHIIDALPGEMQSDARAFVTAYYASTARVIPQPAQPRSGHRVGWGAP